MNPTIDTQHPEWLKDFIPLPSDPAQLTIEHVRMAFAGDWSALKDVVIAAKEVMQSQQLNVVSTE